MKDLGDVYVYVDTKGEEEEEFIRFIPTYSVQYSNALCDSLLPWVAQGRYVVKLKV